MICNLKFVLLLSGSARCFGLCFFFFFFFFFSSYKYNGLVQDCGRVLYTVSFSQLKGFLDVGHPPFFEFHERNEYFYFHLPLCLNIYISSFMYEIFIFISHIIWLCGSSTQEFSSPRLEHGGEFLLHHQDRVNWFLLARFFIIPKLWTIILSSLMIRLFSNFSSNVMDC